MYHTDIDVLLIGSVSRNTDTINFPHEVLTSFRNIYMYTVCIYSVDVSALLGNNQWYNYYPYPH